MSSLSRSKESEARSSIHTMKDKMSQFYEEDENKPRSIHNLDPILIHPDTVLGSGPCTYGANLQIFKRI